MRPFREIFRVLLIRDQLMLGWKIGFFIVCAALVIGSMTLARINVRAENVGGIVISHRSQTTESGTVSYLIVRLDSGVIVEARFHGPLNYRPGHRALVREVTTNFFGLKKHEFKSYVDAKSEK
ncbi:MAG: enolase [Deltaproteobacteria bacterium]|nr:enolase [Deltaproteobacteria bacterium]